ncbi:MAG: ROK family transcriptional regulator [Deltaproteobacteria bacterium]|nr:ROK family transcriptional regulator [Deltaproteobacteria bacterium]
MKFPKNKSNAFFKPDTALGSNQIGVRQHNERIILHIIRRSGSISKAEIARITNLSQQTVSVIINRLIRTGLLIKLPKQRGKVGQPSVPITLNPDGAFSIGIKIGRSSLDILTMSLTGEVKKLTTNDYHFPDPDDVFEKIDKAVTVHQEALSMEHRGRLVGIGVAAPYGIGGWEQEIGAPQKIMQKWDNLDIRSSILRSTDLEVLVSNDATAACIAELVFGQGRDFQTFLYFFIGTFIGGGVVIEDILYPGTFQNAGALGSMPICSKDGRQRPKQLIQQASLFHLERTIKEAGFSPELLREEKELPNIVNAIVTDWISTASRALAFAMASAISIIDFEGIVIDGRMSPALIKQLVDQTIRNLDELNLEGLVTPKIIPGTIGPDARALGGAILPLYSNFAPDPDIILLTSSIQEMNYNKNNSII